MGADPGARLAAAGVFLSMFLWGFSNAIASLATQWPIVPQGAYLYLLLSLPLGLLSGNLLMGHLADRYGRKPVMVLALAIYSAGSALIAVAGSWQLIALGIWLLELSIAGGDEPAMISYLAEVSSPERRGRALMAASNGANVGAAAAAALFMAAAGDYGLQRLALVLTLVLALPLAAAIRARLAESEAWIRASGRRSEGSLGRQLRDPLKAYFLVAIAITTVLTYGLVSWALGPYFYPGATSYIMLTFNLGAAAGGIAGYWLVEMAGRRWTSLAYYVGGLATGAAVIAQLILLPSEFQLFEALLALNGVFTQLTWGLRLLMEAELFHTASRATSISLVRASAWVAYAASLAFTQAFTPVAFMWYDAALWALGVSGAALWAAAGYETRGRPVEELDALAVGGARPEQVR